MFFVARVWTLLFTGQKVKDEHHYIMLR